MADWICLALLSSAADPNLERTVVRKLTAEMLTKEGSVSFQPSPSLEIPAAVRQRVYFGESLRTHALSRAAVEFADYSDLQMKELTRLSVVSPTASNDPPSLDISSGQIFISSRQGPIAVPMRTPHLTGIPKGTEFLIAVEENQTVVTMLDGSVELSNAANPVPVLVPSGKQGIAVPGQPIVVQSILQARRLVQWWIYYPGIMDPSELALTPFEESLLSASLAAYREGDLPNALKRYPGYPVPLEPETDSMRVYLAGVLLAVGAVDRAYDQLSKVTSNLVLPAALQTLMAAVQQGPHSEARGAGSVSESASGLLADSYACQSTNGLKQALSAARKAIERSPNFGFGWARVAELEFSFGQTRAAHRAVEKALALTPRNAQAHALRGFLLAAENHLHDAINAFDQAILIDPALGNAWLGRGLCKRRMGKASGQAASSDVAEGDWLRDLQTAAILEPTRSLVRSYAGKAFSDLGDSSRARKEFALAEKLDPKDPTPRLYSAFENHRAYRPNDAVRDLERSIDLNDNRAVYRSRLMLDRDEAVRRASLATIYQAAGLEEVGLREAARAVNYDYANYSAHQFLAESFNALRDPTRFNLRYETAWFNELLLANLLRPVGAGLLSQSISQQEYAGLFEAKRMGLASSTEVRSDGQYRESASQHAVFGSTSYSLDIDYQHNDGSRPNSDLNRIEWYTQIKQQITPEDSLFVLTKYQDYESGDNFQRYNPQLYDPTLRARDLQQPIVLGAWHHEWSPGMHTLAMGGRLTSDQKVDQQTGVLNLVTNTFGTVTRVRTEQFGALRYENLLEGSFAEIGQIWQSERHTLLAGGRAQWADFQTTSSLSGLATQSLTNRYSPPVVTRSDAYFERYSIYLYDTYELVAPIRLIAGLAYDGLRYPGNFRSPPLMAGVAAREQISPKCGFIWDLSPRYTVRALYSQALGGVSFDESFRLEPTQLAGFVQSYRSLISEAEVGSVSAPRHEIFGLALDGKLPRDLYLSVHAGLIRSRVENQLGAFYDTFLAAPPQQAFPATTREELSYREVATGLGLQKLLGDEWAVGGGYQFTRSTLDWFYPQIPVALLRSPSRTEQSELHELRQRVRFQHPCGFFSRLESLWMWQGNDGYSPQRESGSLYQLNIDSGWRFLRRRAAFSLGVLNVTDAHYRLSSLTPYSVLPQERVYYAKLRFEF